MRTTNEKGFASAFLTKSLGKNGFAFSMDLLSAFIGICLISLVSIEFLNSSVQASAAELQGFELEKNTIMLLDAMVKNRNSENSALGAAVFNEEKRRVEENNIDVEFLEKANPIVTKNVSLKKIEIVFRDGERKTIIDYPQAGENCLAAGRLVRVQGQKALLEGVVCIE